MDPGAVQSPPAARARVARDRAQLLDGGNIPLGVALVIASSLLFAVGGASMRLLSAEVPPTSALIWRNVVSAAGVVLWFSITGWPLLRSARADLHIARGVATFAGLWAYFWAVATIPLSTAVLLRTAAPVFVPIVAFVLYRRRSDRNVWIGAWIGLVGVALVVRPSGITMNAGDLLGVTSGILGAVAAVLIWRLGGIDGVSTQLAWLTAAGLACSALVAPAYLTLPAAADWPLIVVIAASTTASQVILAYAFKVAPTDKTITWGYLSVVFGAVFGALLFSEYPSALSVGGMGLVVLGSHIACLKARASG
ncbi:MAG: DMT family transporter [Hyphomicrobiaceae bacterium]